MSERGGSGNGEDEDRDLPDVPEGEVVGDEEAPGEVTFRAYRYRSPIPPPQWMEHYERIVPGSAEQMIGDMHDQSVHRREIERDEANTEITLATRGQLFGFITACAGFVVVMTAIVGGLLLIYSGMSLGAGLALTLLALAAVAAVFVANRFAARPPGQEAPQEDPVTVRRQPPPG